MSHRIRCCGPGMIAIFVFWLAIACMSSYAVTPCAGVRYLRGGSGNKVMQHTNMLLPPMQAHSLPIAVSSCVLACLSCYEVSHTALSPLCYCPCIGCTALCCCSRMQHLLTATGLLPLPCRHRARWVPQVHLQSADIQTTMPETSG